MKFETIVFYFRKYIFIVISNRIAKTYQSKTRFKIIVKDNSKKIIIGKKNLYYGSIVFVQYF